MRHQPLPSAVVARERTPDRVGDTRILHVDEERLPVGSEGRAGELVVARQPIQRENVRVPFRGDPDDAILVVAVLGQPDVAPRGDDQVVRQIQRVRAGRLEDEFERVGAHDVLGPRDEPVDLTTPRLAALRVVEPQRAAREVRALEPREAHGPLASASACAVAAATVTQRTTKLWPGL